MKELLLAALKSKFKGGNANLLDRIATLLAKTVSKEEDVATAVEGVTEDYLNLIEAYGDSRATDAQKTAVMNYEKKHGLKNGQRVEVTVEPDKPAEEGNDGVPAWASALIESNRQLTERLNKIDTDHVTSARKQQLTAITQKLPESLRKPYERMTLDTLTTEQFDTLIGEVTTEVDGIVSGLSAKGAVFGKPAARMGGSHQGEELTEAQQAAIAVREGAATTDGQPF